MPVFRINKDKNYTVMSNYHLKDSAMSLKAKGLLSLMLSLPETWDYSVNGLVAICKEEIRAIRSTLKELETLKYLKRERIKVEGGRFDYVYQIFESPYIRFVHTENVHAHNVHTQKDTQLNKENKITKNKRKSKKKIDFEQREYQPEELEKLYSNLNKK